MLTSMKQISYVAYNLFLRTTSLYHAASPTLKYHDLLRVYIAMCIIINAVQ